MEENKKIVVLSAIASIFAILLFIFNNTSTSCQQDIEELVDDSQSEFLTGLMQENFIIYESVLITNSPALLDDHSQVEKWKSDINKHDEWRKNYRVFINDTNSTIQRNKSCVRKYNKLQSIFNMSIVLINFIIFLSVKSKDSLTKKKKSK